MLDRPRIGALVAAGIFCFRPKYFVGLVIVAVVFLLDVSAMLAPVLHRPEALSPGYVFVVLLWGPSGIPSAQPFAATAWLPNPFARMVMSTILPAIAAFIVFRRATPLRPESESARALDRVGLTLILVSVFEAMVLSLAALITFLSRDL